MSYVDYMKAVDIQATAEIVAVKGPHCSIERRGCGFIATANGKRRYSSSAVKALFHCWNIY